MSGGDPEAPLVDRTLVENSAGSSNTLNSNGSSRNVSERKQPQQTSAPGFVTPMPVTPESFRSISSSSVTAPVSGTTSGAASESAAEKQVQVQITDDDDKDGSWKKKFDPVLAVRRVTPSVPPHTWHHYIAEKDVKASLQRIARISAQNYENGIQSSVLAAIRKITRGAHLAGPNASSAYKVVLLHGPPGCGKTHAVQVMACEVAEAGVEVYQMDLTSIKSSWVGQTEHQLKRVLNYIGQKKNAIVFLDEIDSFVGEFNRQDKYNAPLLTQVLQWIDGIDTRASDQNLIIICATNCMQACDPAFLSRCSTKIEIPPPSQRLRQEWWGSRAQHLREGERGELACYPVDSFRTLEQMITDLEEESAETSGYAPCFADYRFRLQRVCREGGPPASNNNRDAHSTSKSRSSNNNTHDIDLVKLMDQVKSLAAATAATTVATMNYKHPDKGSTHAEMDMTGLPPMHLAGAEESTKSTTDESASVAAVEELDNHHDGPQPLTENDHDPSPSNASLETMRLMESRMDKLESSLTQQLKYTALETALANLKRDYSTLRSQHNQQQEAWNQQQQFHQTQMSALQKELTVTQTEVRELREWETARVYWKIDMFEKRLHNRSMSSRSVTVAGKSMRLNLEVARISVANMEQSTTDPRRPVGLFIYYAGGGEGKVAKVGGSSVTICAKDSSHENLTNKFGEQDQVEENCGFGKRRMTTLKTLMEKYLDYSSDPHGVLRVRATIRVGRLGQQTRVDISGP